MGAPWVPGKVQTSSAFVLPRHCLYFLLLLLLLSLPPPPSPPLSLLRRQETCARGRLYSPPRPVILRPGPGVSRGWVAAFNLLQRRRCLGPSSPPPLTPPSPSLPSRIPGLKRRRTKPDEHHEARCVQPCCHRARLTHPRRSYLLRRPSLLASRASRHSTRSPVNAVQPGASSRAAIAREY